jgi:hypothetical protein
VELEGTDPSELAGIRVKGENKWLTLIQNASLRRSRLVVDTQTDEPTADQFHRTLLHRAQYPRRDAYKTRQTERVMRATTSFGLTSPTAMLDLVFLQVRNQTYTRVTEGWRPT